MQKAVFLDRDGIINKEIGDYVFRTEDFEIVPGVIELLEKLKEAEYVLVIITNQAGIARGRYTKEDMQACHTYFQKQSGYLIDKFYHAPGHPDFSESLSRKPGSLLFEKAMARFNVDPLHSWMIGDKERDLIPASKLGFQTIRLLLAQDESEADYVIKDISEIEGIILSP